ncbi:hypothetical protein [Rhodococcus sp. IEGM 1408]|uniref:tetratricopeptide repeat protein n=1 Tax=Rhodococcus sp. IEGM 1408 TaxID=3082220 RepID=UPI0029530284|nr:hypothetical protein [Rhodococcus sp. IEGM 1408]MDV8001558.1 hypothetical protein [Rhodococcus sp. IEGM 1408]
MYSDLHVAALDYFSAECSANGHALCGGDGACESIRSLAVEHRRLDWEWADVDLGRDVLQRVGVPPDATWPTPTLLRFVRDKVLTPPWRDPLRRAIHVTSALAMLGERGIGPDMVLRGFLAPAVATQLLYDLSLSVWAMESGSDEPLPSAPEMQPWLKYVEDCLSRCRGLGGEITLDHLMHETRKGARRDVIDRWVEDAAAAHLIAWKLEGYERTEAAPDDRVLAGGQSVSRWVYERFTRTSPREWCTRSIELEIAWANDPLSMAALAGVSSEVLTERQFPMTVLWKALGRSVLGELQSGDSESVDVEQVLEDIVRAIQAGDRFAAVHRARKAWLDDPQNAVWGNALAFCSIPDDPELAIRLLSAVSNEVENVSRSVNLAAAHIVLGDLDGVRKHFDSIEGNVAAWYWEPDSLWSGDPVAVEIEPVRWLESAREVLRMASEG